LRIWRDVAGKSQYSRSTPQPLVPTLITFGIDEQNADGYGRFDLRYALGRGFAEKAARLGYPSAGGPTDLQALTEQ
jgi:hypothetical protein